MPIQSGRSDYPYQNQPPAMIKAANQMTPAPGSPINFGNISSASNVADAAGSASGVGTALQGAGAGAGLAGMAGMGAMLGPIGIGIGALGTIANIFESKKARKEAKKAAEKQAKTDAMINLINVAKGQGASRIDTGARAPQVGYGNALQDLGNAAKQRYNMNRQSELDREASTLNQARAGYYQNRGNASSGRDTSDLDRWLDKQSQG